MTSKKMPTPPITDAVMAQMLQALPGIDPPMKRRAAMKQVLLQKVMRESSVASLQAATKSAREMIVVRAGEGAWIDFAPNVAMKVLNDDGHTRAWLARFGPGGQIPAHMQSGDEEAIIMEGWCYLDDLRINQGDYHFIGKGMRHGNIHSPEGCLIFVRSHSSKRHASELNAAR